MSRAWVITKDRIADETEPQGTNSNAVGITGPRDADRALLADLMRGGGYRFIIKDDDGETYYEGRATWSDDDEEEGPYGPLGDFGMPNAGATSITYPGHKEYDCA